MLKKENGGKKIVYFTKKYKSSEKADSYSVDILDDYNVKFKHKKISSEFDNKEYDFTEAKIE